MIREEVDGRPILVLRVRVRRRLVRLLRAPNVLFFRGDVSGMWWEGRLLLSASHHCRLHLPPFLSASLEALCVPARQSEGGGGREKSVAKIL